MSKVDYIKRIESYLNDGFIQVPAGTSENLDYNSVTLADFRQWTELLRESLDSLNKAGKLNIIPEGTLNSIVNNIEAIRRDASTLHQSTPDLPSRFMNAVNRTEQSLGQVTQYLNLADSVNYRNLSSKLENSINKATENFESKEKKFNSLATKTSKLNTRAENLLKKTSSGTLSENFDDLSNSKWNISLMVLSLIISFYAFVMLTIKSNELSDFIITALENGSVNYSVIFVKWSITTPYLLLLSIGLLELRSRIRARDTYVYRKNVAGALDGYTETLLNKVEGISNNQEKSIARRSVIEFMINSLLELTKTPSNRQEKQTVGVKVKDVAEAKISNLN